MSNTTTPHRIVPHLQGLATTEKAKSKGLEFVQNCGLPNCQTLTCIRFRRGCSRYIKNAPLIFF